MNLRFKLNNKYYCTIFNNGIRIQTIDTKFVKWIDNSKKVSFLNSIKNTIKLNFNDWTKFLKQLN